MSEEIKKLQPAEVWENFYALTQIPRPSKHEQQGIEFLEKFGKDHGLETIIEPVGNVIIRKPATPGMEDRMGIVLQAHIDMVPQKNSDTQHDFEKDPIDAYIDGEWVKARGTTLGADNGIGLAAAMGVLASKTLKHGPIEALFTVDEETGMTGAFGLQPDSLKGDILLNLDSEDEGELYVGCAGGLDATIALPYQRNEDAASRDAIRLEIKGLLGGHSGVDIALYRANSIKLMVRLLKHLEHLDPRIVQIEGGNLRNAIPREAFATLALPAEKADEFIAKVKEYEKTIQAEYALADKGITITAIKADKEAKMLDAQSHQNIVGSLLACPNGVVRMSEAMHGLVETSTNLASINDEGDHYSILCLLRSSVDSAKFALAEEMDAIFSLAGGKAEFSGAYPGWNPKMDAPILKTMQNTYEREYGRVPKTMAIHAGLECGLIGGVYPKMDMISFGPTIRSPHSPDERVKIDTVAMFWDFLVKVLADAPKK
ncbi:MAG: cytosol nonspecific dipeptidase [Bacteroidetes bacterium]|nr:MAG: cytosol nonspecific dipeptidase [Bacteroidota bacterium]